MLPLKRGIYVDRRVPCKDASNVATMSYWGGNNGLNVAKAECRIGRIRRSGSAYVLNRTCSGGRSDEVRIEVLGRSAFLLNGVTYRYCGKRVRF